MIAATVAHPWQALGNGLNGVDQPPPPPTHTHTHTEEANDAIAVFVDKLSKMVRLVACHGTDGHWKLPAC
jgi:hypothetical protein